SAPGRTGRRGGVSWYTSRKRSWQYVTHGDRPDFTAVHDNRHGLRLSVMALLPICRLIGRAGRVGVDLNLLVRDIHDPIDRDAIPGVDRPLHRPIQGYRAVGDLDGQGDVVGPGVVMGVPADRTADHGDIRLRLTPAGGHGRLPPAKPICRQD